MSAETRDSKSARAAIQPILSVRNGARTVEFYKATFQAVQTYRVDSETGDVVARLSVDGAEFWLADESPEHQNFSPQSLGGGTVRMALIVDDPERGIRAGCRRRCPGGLAGERALRLAARQSR